MNGTRWAEIERLFADALELDAEARAGHVRSAATQEDIADEVLALLDAHARTGLFDALDDERPSDRVAPGTRLGAWEVVGELGRGGMGVVYRVRRADGQFELEAALKILPALTSGPDAAARFLAERQILARLSHRHIARLLDGGVSADGQPWFVMERVEGQPVDAYCDARRLGVRERLRIFVLICRAVQYAHQRLVIHRDLKPGNILVSVDGEPRLLDFGIAKVLDQDGDSGHASLTRAGARALTPEYASPEQRRGDPVTTASDVYQLGLLLHRLLVGGPPNGFSTGGAEPGYGTVLAPSRALLESPDREPLASMRATTPAALARALRGDLDAILLKALRPEPEERYGTVGQLAEDIDRHLGGRPVRARPDTWRYVGGKFARRHALALGGTGGAFLLLVGLLLGIRRQAVETAIERDRAEQVVELLVGLFDSADPRRTPADSTMTVRDVLDRGVVRVREELAAQPAVQSTLLNAIGEVYSGLGAGAQAVELVGEALSIGGPVLGADDPRIARMERRLGLLHAQAGDFPEAEALLTAAEDRLARLRRLSPAERADAIGDIGYAWQVLGRLDRAEPLLERAAQAWALVPERAVLPAATLTNLGWLRMARADLDSAEVLFRDGLELRRAMLGREHLAVATSLEALADVLARKGDLAGSDSTLAEALAIRSRALDAMHPAVLALRVQRAELMRRDGRPDEAERELRSALEAQVAVLGEEHFSVADTRNEIAIALRQQGRDAEAEPYLRASIAGYQRAFGSEHANPAIVEVSLARLLLRAGRSAEAEPYYAHAVPILRVAFPDNSEIVRDLASWGWIRCKADGPALLEEAVRVTGAGNSPGGDVRLQTLNALADCLVRRGEHDEGLRVAEASLDASAARADSDPYRAYALTVRDRALGGAAAARR
jgi:serine/threonine-protein kinase